MFRSSSETSLRLESYVYGRLGCSLRPYARDDNHLGTSQAKRLSANDKTLFEIRIIDPGEPPYTRSVRTVV